MKPIPGFSGYFVDLEVGTVFSDRFRKRVLPLKASPCSLKNRRGPGDTGYLKVGLIHSSGRKYLMVHRIVALVGLGERPAGMVINHKNGNKTDNRLCNLEYITMRENYNHAIEVLGRPLARRLSAEIASQIRSEYRPYRFGSTRLAKKYGVTPRTIQDILNNKAYRV